jgi:GNAT superfamily N-acetyltransferase
MDRTGPPLYENPFMTASRRPPDLPRVVCGHAARRWRQYHFDMTLRSTTIEDLNTILEHRLAMFCEMGRDDPHELANLERVSREYFETAIPSGTFHGVLAELDEGGVVGGGGVVIVPWPGAGKRSRPCRPWILNVYVRAEYRRLGIARAIMEALIQWCESQGFDCVCLHATSSGRPLYEQLGFIPTNEMRLDLCSSAPSEVTG